MNNNNSGNMDLESLYISSRIFEFVLENTKKVKPSIDLKRFEAIYGKIAMKDTDHDIKIDLPTLMDFLHSCFSSNFTFDDFYEMGNRIHELHFSLISLLFKLNVNFAYPVKNEISFMSVGFSFKKDVLNLKITIDNLLVLDAKEICVPILKLVHGFVDRLFLIYLNNKPEVTQKEASLEFSYSQNFVSDFDIARYITNEQFFFSRLKNHMYEIVDEGVVKKVEFYLFRDISFSIEEIAGRLGVSVRALQRKLKEEEMSFRKIKETIRKALAEKYLLDESLSIQEVSDLLAYSERSAFEKAFKKWYGKNPNVFRKDNA